MLVYQTNIAGVLLSSYVITLFFSNEIWMAAGHASENTLLNFGERFITFLYYFDVKRFGIRLLISSYFLFSN